MGNKVEELVVLRRRLLAVSVVGYAVWIGIMALKDSLTSDQSVATIFSWVGFVGALLWMVSMWRLSLLQRFLQQQPEIARTLEDELVRSNRAKAAYIALMTMMLFNGAMIAGGILFPHPLTGLAIAELNLVFGYVGFVGGFIYLDTKES